MRILAWILLSVAALCLPASAERALRNGIAAIVNDSIITYQEVEDNTAQFIDLLRRTYYNQPDVFQQKAFETHSDALEQLVETQLILYDFKNAGGKVPESLINDELKRIIQEKFGDRVRFINTLKAQGVTLESFKQRLQDKKVVQYMTEKNIRGAVLISPQKIERYYATNLTHFKLGDQVKLRMIVLNRPSTALAEDIRHLAEEILIKINEGASFSEMAAVYSEGSQRREGGDWGWVEASVLNKGLADVAFALKPGQNSGVIALAREDNDTYWIYQYDKNGQVTSGRKYTDKGGLVEEKKFESAANATLLQPRDFYLMLVEDKRIARTKALPEVRDEIEKTLVVQERSRLHKKWIERLKAKSFVRYFN
jgi:parvulin-like peptidyl-prolyl isomerase